MPALLVHMTLAEQMNTRPDATGPLADAARVARDALLLGSVLPDLPYHGRFAFQVVRHLAGRDYLPSEWGDLLHTRATGRLALAMLAHVARSHAPRADRARVLAMTAGYLSHHAVDRVVHPVINRLVSRERERDPETKEPVARTHERMERYQNVFFHGDLLGHELFGSPYPRKIVGAMAGAGLLRPALDASLFRALRAACLETHGRAPSCRQVRDWLRGTTTYGALVSSPLSRVDRPRDDLQQLRQRYYQGPEVDLLGPLEQAQEATAEAWQAAARVLGAERLGSEVRAVFLSHVEDVDLGTGA